jgi:acyl-CoA dehydrogenase
MDMTAARDGNHFVLNGEKTWISNGGIAGLYCVFARTGEGPGAKGLVVLPGAG